jgi:predicted DNA-binding transcriptional regulator AlpA
LKPFQPLEGLFCYGKKRPLCQRLDDIKAIKSLMFLACATMRRVISCITVVDQSALARRRKGIDMQLLNLQAVLSLLMVSRTTLHKLRQVDGFPPPAVRCGKVLRWRQDDVLGWIEAQAKKGTPEAA